MSAGEGDHPFFFTFIYMIPIACKITKFSYTCLLFQLIRTQTITASTERKIT